MTWSAFNRFVNDAGIPGLVSLRCVALAYVLCATHSVTRTGVEDFLTLDDFWIVLARIAVSVRTNHVSSRRAVATTSIAPNFEWLEDQTTAASALRGLVNVLHRKLSAFPGHGVGVEYNRYNSPADLTATGAIRSPFR